MPKPARAPGTIGMELADWKEQIDAVLLPLGNGALACGVGRYLKEVRPEIRVIAIQSAGRSGDVGVVAAERSCPL